jgi:tRNA U55 pseudouridine synthase TruB
VRSLAKDFGERLNLPAHIDRIARTRVGSFDRAQGFRSDRLFDGDVSGLTGLDLSDALDFLPGVVLDDKAQRALRYGTLPGIKDVVQSYGDVKTGGPVRILDGSGGLIAIGERSRGKRRNPLQLVDSFRLYTESKPNGGLRRAR